MSVGTKEAVKETPRTFRTMEERPATKEYHYMQRTVGPMALPDGTVNSDMLDLAVGQWLEGGFTLAEVHYLGQHKGDDGNIRGYVYGYHFVK